MTRLAVISDSHDAARFVEMFAARALAEKYDAVIHCGDGKRDVSMLQKLLPMPVYSVCGNCDFMCDAPRSLTLRFEKLCFFITHGDHYRVKVGMDALSYKAEEVGAQVALFGHTHQPFAAYRGNVMLVNPGALRMGLYAELTVDGDKAEPRCMTL